MTIKVYPQLVHGNLLEFGQADLPHSFLGWHQRRLHLPNTGTHFGFVYQGNPILYRHTREQEFKLYPGMYFSFPGEGWIGSEDSSGFVVTCPDCCGTFSIGGPIEPTGRFAYIDGGTDSLLIPPLILGAPCLNALYFPPVTDQTMHTHPSYRLGMVIAGLGECETPQGITPFLPGVIFFIPAGEEHKFRTFDNKLTLVVFHPDSDVGFTHHNHPMLNRTIVTGVSASQLPQIQTKNFCSTPENIEQ